VGGRGGGEFFVLLLFSFLTVRLGEVVMECSRFQGLVVGEEVRKKFL
jgi:hypothetical protein